MKKEKKTKAARKAVIVPAILIFLSLVASLSVYSALSHTMASSNIDRILNEDVSRKSTMMEDFLKPEIALVKKMACSPVIQDFFVDPHDKAKKERAFAEFASYRNAYSSHIVFWANDIDREFWNGMKYSYTIDPSNPADYWYKMTLHETDIYNFNINYNAELNMTCLWLNAVVRDSKKNPIGMTGTGIELDSFTGKSFEDLNKDFSMYFFNEGKEITGSLEKRLLVDKVGIDSIYGQEIDFDVLMKKAKKIAADSDQALVFNMGPYVHGAIRYLPSYDWYLILTAPVAAGRNKGLYIFLLVIIVIELIFIIFVVIISKTFVLMNQIKLSQQNEHRMGQELFESAQNLVVSTKETAATSQDSSAAVKEIVATMEDSNVLSENISKKIKDVSSVANSTSSDVTAGVAQIEQNVKQLHEIFDANHQTIEGIKNLSEKIENIWDIVTLINNVADQAKIIAFNAELEASSAGEAGKSFRIVANEIRRLSDGIIDGTREIKEKITEIQHSSDALILASESSTEKINTGYDNARNLGEKFDSIKKSAEITAKSSDEIAEIIQQLAGGSEQILLALKEIAAGVENFTVATDNISNAAENVRKISEDLNKASSEG